MEEPSKGDPETPCMDVYMAKIQYDGIIENLKLIIVVRGGFQIRRSLETPSPQ